MQVKTFSFVGLAALLQVGVATAQDGPKANYERGSFIHAGGYQDQQLGPNSWKVTATIGGAKPYWLTEKVALYRSAELVERAGYRYVKIDKREGDRYVINGPVIFSQNAGGKTKIFVSGVNEPSLSGNCSTEITMLCSTFLAADAKREILPYLNINPHR